MRYRMNTIWWGRKDELGLALMGLGLGCREVGCGITVGPCAVNDLKLIFQFLTTVYYSNSLTSSFFATFSSVLNFQFMISQFCFVCFFFLNSYWPHSTLPLGWTVELIELLCKFLLLGPPAHQTSALDWCHILLYSLLLARCCSLLRKSYDDTPKFWFIMLPLHPIIIRD